MTPMQSGSESNEAAPKGTKRTAARTAVVIVHGMGEQTPVESLNKFVGNALPKYKDIDQIDSDAYRHYYSRDARVAHSFEARRYLAPAHDEQPRYGQTEFFEYHWSYKMTGNRFGDFLPTAIRILFRRPSTVPSGLRGIWWIIWAVVLAVLIGGLVYFWRSPGDWDVPGLILVIIAIPGVKGVLAWFRRKTGQVFTDSFVDVVRYLDRSPRSYEVRKSIRQGMVDLLQSLHDELRYSRIVLVAHSLGAYIAYDGIAALWPAMSKLHCGPISQEVVPLEGLEQLHRTAKAVLGHPDSETLNETQERELTEYREAQFAVWKGLRKQGNPWLVTDLITVGTPMYFADLLFTRSRRDFDRLVKTAELPTCPPRHHDQFVDGPRAEGINFAWPNKGRQVLSHAAPFAVVRWTNLFFDAENGWNGDWFGGRLRPLFGKGIIDTPVPGNLPNRKKPGIAHALYFESPEDDGPGDVAGLLKHHLDLGIDLSALLETPNHLNETAGTL